MYQRKRLPAGIILACLLVVPVAGGQDTTVKPFQGDARITGRVVDLARMPVAGADVGTFWSRNDSERGQASKTGNREEPEFRPFGAATTDADGRFSLETSFHGGPRALMAMNR